MSTPENQEADALLASLDAEFGKPRKSGKSDTLKSPRGRRDSSELHYASWAKQQLEYTRGEPQVEVGVGEYDPRPSWIPEAKLTYVIVQHCRTCADKVSFIGGEYIRFRSTRAHATIIRRQEVVTDLWHYPLDHDLDDLIDTIHQEVGRCPGCIQVEQQAAEIWSQATRSQVQAALFAEQPVKPRPPITTEQLKAMVAKPIGWKRGDKKDEDIEIDI